MPRKDSTMMTPTRPLRTTFAYDGLGRLRVRTEYTNTAAAPAFGQPISPGPLAPSWRVASVTRYIYDGYRVIQERDGNNNPLVSYTRGTDLSGSLEGAGGIGGLLARSSGFSNGAWTNQAYYFADGNGNISTMLDGNENIVASYRYDPYGNSISSSGSLAAANVYRFSSKEFMTNSGMYYYGFRLYDPNVQRWCTRDPYEELGGLNLYSFVFNAPTVLLDPNGLCGGGGGADPDLQNCFAQAIAQYAASQNKRFMHAAAKHMLWTTLSAIGTAIGGLAAIGTGGGVVLTPPGAIAEGALTINDAILGGVLVHEAGKIAREAKDKLKHDLDKCADDSSDPDARKKADETFARFNPR